MMLEETSGSLRILGEWLFDLVRELTGGEPQPIPSGGWYRARSAHGVFMYFRFTGARARKYPRDSIHLAAKWNERLVECGATDGNNWFGRHASADLAVRPEEPGDLAPAEKFVRYAFDLQQRHRGR